MAETTPAKKPAATTVSPSTKSEILAMIQSHINLANKLLPVEDVDVYSRGNSPGPVDQYTKGSPTSFYAEVSDPAQVQQKAGTVAGTVGQVKEG